MSMDTNLSSDSNRQGARVPASGAANAPVLDDSAQVRRLERQGGWTRRERLRLVWYRIRLTVQEMNYATRRLVELQMREP
jgi:hypothetical protein